MISPNALLSEQVKIVTCAGPVAPSSTTPDYVNLKGAGRVAFVIAVKNTTTVTGSAISFTQATDVSNTSGKTLAFTTAYRALNTGAGGNTDVLTSFAVASNTFTTDATNSTENLYVVEFNATDIDSVNNFTCVRPNCGNSTNATVSIVAYLFPLKYAKTTLDSFIS